MIFRLSDDMSKFRSEVRCYSAADIPVLAVFTIDKETADEIRELQKLVEVNKLFKVEKFDSRVCWYKGHTQTTVQDAMLNVSSEHFWFSAYVKHNRVEIMTELFLMWDLPYPNGDIKKSSNSIANCSLL